MSRILFTKNGHRTGNAIVVKEVEPTTEAMKAFLAIDNSKMYLVETDFGNRMRLTTKELNAQFDLGPKQSYKKWAADRAELRQDVKIQDEIDAHDKQEAPKADTRPICSEDGCYRREDCGPSCRNRN